MSAKKSSAKKSSKKSTAKKAVKKAAKATKKATSKKAVTKKVSAKKTASKKKAKPSIKAKEIDDLPEASQKRDASDVVLNARKRKSTPNIFKIRRKNTPILFTLNDVQEIIKKKKTDDTEEKAVEKATSKKAAKKVVKIKEKPVKNMTHQAASVMDILGFNPAAKAKSSHSLYDEGKVPKKWLKHYKALIEMREHVMSGLDMHTQETLHRSNKEDSGDLSNYGQHMADAGTDSFDRDFALSLVSSEQEALSEIETAIRRIFDGSYGVCEITNEPIKKERLMAVPFTRHSLEGQRQLEKNKRKVVDRSPGGLGGFGSEEGIALSDDGDDS